MKEIREWLGSAGVDYAAGLALYEAHGRSRVVLKSLQYGATAFTWATLRRELAKLAEAPEKVAGPPEKVVSSPRKVGSSAPDADELRRQRSAWFAERARLHAQLELVASDAARRAMAERLLELSQHITLSYDAPGAPPVATPRPDLAALADAGEQRRLLANLRCQASKLKKRPDRATDLAQVLADIHLLETKLKP